MPEFSGQVFPEGNPLHLSRYFRLVEALRSNPQPEGYTEKHHILPQSLCGTNVTDNIIVVSPKAHFVLHHILWKAYENFPTQNLPMSTAFHIMQKPNQQKNQNNSYVGHLTAKEYASIRLSMAEARVGLFAGEKNPFFGKKHSETTRAIIREKRANQTMTERTLETRQRQRGKRLGKPTRAGAKNSPKHCQAIAESIQGSFFVLCPLCGRKYRTKTGTWGKGHEIYHNKLRLTGRLDLDDAGIGPSPSGLRGVSTFQVQGPSDFSKLFRFK